MPKKLPLFFLLLLSFAFACKKVDIKFGDQFLDNDYTQVIKVDSFTADLNTIYVDSFVTSGLGVSLIGGYTDPYFGTASLKTYCELIPPAYVDSFAFTTFDSLALLIIPDKSYYGDTTKSIHVDVHRLSESIIGYETNLSVLYNTQNFAVNATPIGSKDFVVRPARADTIKIRLNDALGKELLTKLQDPNDNDIKGSDFFLQYFKGLRISSPAGGSVAFGAKDSVTMRLYYKKPGAYLQGKEWDFKLGVKTHHFNNISVDRSAAVLKDLATTKKISSASAGNRAFTSYIMGAMTKIRFPSVRDIFKIKNYVKILKATLVVRPERGTYTTDIALPPLLRLSSTTTLNRLGDDLAVFVNGTASAQTGNLFIDYLSGENTSYAYDVTSYIKTLTLDGTLNDNGVLLVPPSPALVTRFNRIIVGDKNNSLSKTELVIVYATVK